jgi:hypothetical protein
MNVEIWIKAAQFPEKKYINGIFLVVHVHSQLSCLYTNVTKRNSSWKL